MAVNIQIFQSFINWIPYFYRMKRICLIFILIAPFVSYSQDHLLLPDSFFIQKGETFQVRLMTSVDLKEPKEQKFLPASTTGLWFYDGGKKEDLKTSATADMMPVLSRKQENSGLVLLAMDQNLTDLELPKKDLVTLLRDNGFEKFTKSAEAKNKQTYIIKNQVSSKTLAMVEKSSGGLFNQKIGQDLEILLLQNPYKMLYGDDLIAEILFKGKPVVNSQVEVLTKGSNGNLFKQNYSTDKGGRIYFKLNRAGAWMIRVSHMLPLQDSKSDFESFNANYTFGFR
jgi:hypothetical protein